MNTQTIENNAERNAPPIEYNREQQESSQQSVVRPHSLLGMPYTATQRSQEIEVTAPQGVYIESLLTKEPIHCTRARVSWDNGLDVKVGALVKIPTGKEFNLPGEYVLEVVGEVPNTYVIQERQRQEEERRRWEEERQRQEEERRRWWDPNLEYTLASGETVKQFRIASAIKLFGQDATIKLK